MVKITRDDIQRIGDEDTLLHFFEEKLDLPIPEGLPLEDITTKFAKFALGLSGAVANQVVDCQELSVSPGEPSEIILIRFNSESGYPEALRVVAAGLDKLGRNPADLRFICMNEYFQPFAFAHFNNSESGNWQTAILTIFAWTQNHTRINTGSEHELPTGFFSKGCSNGRRNNPIIPPIETASPEEVLIKLKKAGKPLSDYANVCTGILTGFNKAYVINEFKRQRLIDQDRASRDLIKPILLPSHKWKIELTYLIWIPTSENRRWPWSNTRSDAEAKRIFEKAYPAISVHLDHYEEQLKRRKHGNRGKFYWEFTKNNPHSMPKQSKIVYSYSRKSIQAAYDTSEALPLFANHFIPTEDLTLLAILNSRLFDWYVQHARRTSESNRSWTFKVAFMKAVPVAPRTEVQKAEISALVQQILDNPDSLKVRDLEWEVDQLVYKLYELTPAEIALIEKGTNS